MKVNVQLDNNAKMPTKAHKEDAGFDIYAPEKTIVPGYGGVAVIDTGVHIDIPYGYVGFLKSKSGLNVKHDIQGEGVIDCGFGGSIRVKLTNNNRNSYVFEKGDKIIQLVLLPIPEVELVEVESLDMNSDRGNNGFGSSGK